MNITDNPELAAIEATYVREKSQQRLQDAINHLQRTMYEMELYLEKLEQARDDTHRAQVMNWAISHLVCNIQPNLRIDLLADSQAELAKTGL